MSSSKPKMCHQFVRFADASTCVFWFVMSSLHLTVRGPVADVRTGLLALYQHAHKHDSYCLE